MKQAAEIQGEDIPILSAGIVIARNTEGTWKYLLLRAYRNWDFPKGVVEPGENPLAAALREVEEETGITDLIFPWGFEFRETAPYSGRGRKIARYYLAETRKERVVFSVNPEIGRTEHHEYRWLSWNEMNVLIPERLMPVLAWVRDKLGE